MKVLHLISGGDSGGAKTCLFSLYGKLRHLLYVRVACLTEGVFYRELPDVGVDRVLFRQKNRFDLSVVKSIADMVNGEGFDVLHVHGARANFIAAFVKNKIKAPIVTTMHSDYLYDFDSPVKKLVFTNLNKYALHKTPYYIAVSDSFRDMMISRGFMPNSIYTVYNGMDYSKIPAEFADKADFCRDRGFEYDENKIYVGTAARFDFVKGVDVFVRAAGEVLKNHENVEFVIAGDGDERKKLEQLAKTTGNDDRIHFIGFERDIYSFYNLIDINTLASRSESFPYSMLEGAAVGKPFVASRVGGIPSLVRNGETGLLFESEDHKALADKLSMLICDAELRNELGANIKSRATTYFSADRFAYDHARIYESILRDHKEKREYKKSYDYIFSGYYGFDNNGDDAVLMSLTESIKADDGDARIAVLAKDPKRTAARYGIDAYSRMRPLKLYRAVKRSRVLLSGGGSLLQDETSAKSLYYYLFVIKLAKKLGLPVMMIGNGIGPLRRKRSRRLTRDVINECVCDITLRDADSMKLLDSIGVTVPKTLSADPALLLMGEGRDETERILADAGITPGEYVTVCVRNWKHSAPDMESSIASVLRRIRNERGYNVIFVPMQFPNDAGISERIAALIGDGAYTLKRKLEIKEIISILGGAKLNLAMRLHAMVYSVSEGVPTVALRYDPKVDGFMRYAGLQNTVDVSTLTEDELYCAVVDGLSAYVDTTRRDELRALASINVEHASLILKKEKAAVNSGVINDKG